MAGVRPSSPRRSILLLALTAACLGSFEAHRAAAADFSSPPARAPAAAVPVPSLLALSNARFTVRFPPAVGADRAGEILRILEEGRALILADLGLSSAEPVEALLLEPREFRALTGNPAWVRGAFDGRILVPLGREEEGKPADALRPVLLHELTHFLVRGSAPAGLPPWFEEGLAERFEGTTPADAAAWLSARRAALFAGLDDIDRSIRAGGWHEDAGHQGARLAIQALEALAGERAAARILARVRDGEGFDEALGRLVPGGPAALEARLAGHGADGH